MAVNVVEFQNQIKDMLRQITDRRFPKHQNLVKKLLRKSVIKRNATDKLSEVLIIIQLNFLLLQMKSNKHTETFST